MNGQFHVTARSLANLHRPLARGLKLDHVLCHQEERVVQNDWTVSWCNCIFQLSVVHQTLSLARKKILVRELLDGTLRLTFGGHVLSWTEVATRPFRENEPTIPTYALTQVSLGERARTLSETEYLECEVGSSCLVLWRQRRCCHCLRTSATAFLGHRRETGLRS